MKKAEILSMIRSNRPNDLKEWADYHLAIGFDKITIYDNESTFSVEELFSKYKKIVVRDIKTDVPPDAAIACLYDFVSKEKEDEGNYIAFIDDDEYVYTKENKNIKTILNNKMEVLCLYWKLLSSNNTLEDREGTTIDTFNYTSVRGIDGDGTIPVKSIVNFNKCKNIKWTTDGPHLPTTDREMKTLSGEVFENGFGNRGLSNNFYDNQEIYLYHYFYQTHEDWLFKIKNRPHFSDSKFYRKPAYSILDNNMIDRKRELGI